MEDFKVVLKKVLVLGRPGVGKTSLLQRFVQRIYSGNQIATIGVVFPPLKIIQDDSTHTRLKLQLWDIGGKEPLEKISASYVREAKMVVLMWDPAISKSFEDIEEYLQMLATHKFIGPNADPLNIPIIFAQGKSDIRGVISPGDKAQIVQWVKDFGIAQHYIANTSAKNDSNDGIIDEAFKWSVGPLLAQPPEPEIEAVAQAVEVDDPKAERERLAAEKKAAKAQETAQKKAAKQQEAAQKKAAREQAAAQRQAKKIAKALAKEKADLDKAEEKRIAEVGVGTEAVVKNSAKEYLFKAVVMGDAGVGKTSLVKRYVHDIFSMHSKPTIGVDFALKIINWDESTDVRLHVWDIAGSERRNANSMRRNLSEAVMAIVVWDVTRPETFEQVDAYLKTLNTNLKELGVDGRVHKNQTMIPVIFVPAKVDLLNGAPALSTEQIAEITKLAGENGITQFHIVKKGISSKDNTGIVKAIMKGIHLIFNAMLGPSKSEEVTPTAISTQKYKSTPFKHTREARRKDLDAIDNPRENQKWLWLNYMSISDKGSTTCKSLNARIGSAVVKHDLDPVEHDVLKLLQILDSLETSIPDKLLCRFSLFQETRTKIKEERELLYKAAKLIYEANKNRGNQNNNNPNPNAIANNNNNNLEAVVEATVLHVELLMTEVLKLPKAAQAIIMRGKYELSPVPRNDSRVIDL